MKYVVFDNHSELNYLGMDETYEAFNISPKEFFKACEKEYSYKTENNNEHEIVLIIKNLKNNEELFVACSCQNKDGNEYNKPMPNNGNVIDKEDNNIINGNDKKDWKIRFR